MKSLFFVIIIGLHSSDSIPQMMSDIVIMKSYNLKSFSGICEGIAIHPRVVMTTAECVDGFLFTDFLVQNLYYDWTSNLLNIIVHPQYTKCSGSKNFAILITINIITPINSIACLPDKTIFDNTNLDDCSSKQIKPDYSECVNLTYYEPFEGLSNEVCKLGDKEISNILKNRQVKILICNSNITNLKCPAYYFAHDSVLKICSPNNTTNVNVFNQQRTFVHDVVPWIQDEIQKYVNSVPQRSACILTLITCIVTYFSMQC